MIFPRQWAQRSVIPIPPNDGSDSDRVHQLRHVVARAKVLLAAQIASEKAADARGRLDSGSTRARVTTANAHWMRCAEDRDAKERDLVAVLEAAGYSSPSLSA